MIRGTKMTCPQRRIAKKEKREKLYHQQNTGNQREWTRPRIKENRKTYPFVTFPTGKCQWGVLVRLRLDVHLRFLVEQQFGDLKELCTVCVFDRYSLCWKDNDLISVMFSILIDLLSEIR